VTITSTRRYHEDFAVGQQFRHRRGHTISEADNQMLSLLTMNTAQTHFNRESMSTYMDGAFPQPLLNACVALSIAVGLTTEDIAENGIAEVGMRNFTMPAPIFVGDTIYVQSTIIEVDPVSTRPDAGRLTYALRAHKSAAAGRPAILVLEATRTVLIRKRLSWADRDAALDGRVRRPGHRR
jgi:acyl dehydratase